MAMLIVVRDPDFRRHICDSLIVSRLVKNEADIDEASSFEEAVSLTHQKYEAVILDRELSRIEQGVYDKMFSGIRYIIAFNRRPENEEEYDDNKPHHILRPITGSRLRAKLRHRLT